MQLFLKKWIDNGALIQLTDFWQTVSVTNNVVRNFSGVRIKFCQMCQMNGVLLMLAACNYEDILQCCIPCFEGLLPSLHNETIPNLLYLMNYWHSLLSKLCMHTDTSLHTF